MTLRGTIILTLLALSINAIGQRIGNIKFDTSDCGLGYEPLDVKNKTLIRAVTGVEKYIESIVGKNIIRDHIRLEICMSNQNEYMVYAKDIKNPGTLGQDTCYELWFNVVDKDHIIGYFDLLVDKKGQLFEFEFGSENFNQPHLIRGFRKHFEKQFKVNFFDAVEIGRKKGFPDYPVLKCELDNSFISNRKNEVFVKVKYYWSFHYIWGGGHNAIMKINAETGMIEKEISIPRMPG